MRLGIDLDGVLFDFNTQFVQFCNQEYGTNMPLPNANWPDSWNYHYQYGLKDKNGEIWQRIHQTSTWWKMTPEYPWTKNIITSLQHLDYLGHEVFFITSRSGREVKYASTAALVRVGFEHPCVIPVASPDKKIPVIQALGIKIFVDDKPETVVNIHQQCRKTRSMVFDQPWNRSAEHGIPRGVIRVDGDTMVKKILEAIGGR